MITAMDKSGQWVKALEVFEAMLRAKLKPNIISMSFSEAVEVLLKVESPKPDNGTVVDKQRIYI